MKPKRERNNKKPAILMALLAFIFAFVLITGTNVTAEMYSSISGRVIAEDTGEGLKDISVLLMAREGGRFLAETNEDGLYVIKDLKPGEYIIFFQHKNLPYVMEEPAEVVTLPKGKNLVNVNYVFELGGSIAGTVYKDDGITPLAGALVLAENTSLQRLDPSQGLVLTNSEGNFFLTGLKEADKWIVKVSYKGIVDLAREVKVVKNEVTNGVNFVIPSSTTGITGYVTSSIDGRPLHNVNVVLEEPGSEGKTIGETFSDENGKYSITGAPPGRYEATAFHPESALDWITKENIIIEAGKSTEVNFEFPVSAPTSINEMSLWEAIAGLFVSPAYAMGTLPPLEKRVYYKSCSKKEERKVRAAYNFQKAVIMNGHCTRGNGMPTDVKNDLGAFFSSVHVIRCETGLLDAPVSCGTFHTSCAWTKGNGTLNICKDAFENEKKCGCMQGVITHESIHNITTKLIGGSPEIIPYHCTSSCFACARPIYSACCCRL